MYVHPISVHHQGLSAIDVSCMISAMKASPPVKVGTEYFMRILTIAGVGYPMKDTIFGSTIVSQSTIQVKKNVSRKTAVMKSIETP